VIGRVLRRGTALLVGGTAIACVLVGWLQDPGPLGAAEAVVAARSAFDRAGLDASIDGDAQPGVYEPVSGGGPVAVYRTSADLQGVTVVLYLRRSDAVPVYLDDRSADGGAQLLTEAQFSRLVSGVENPRRHDLLVRNLLLTLAAAAILGVAVLTLALDPDTDPERP
jgi:hypothetical protein